MMALIPYLLFWISWGLAGYTWLMVYRLIESKGKLPEATITEYARGFVFALLLGPLNLIFLAFLLIQKIIEIMNGSNK